MNTTFQDLQNENNPRNGAVAGDRERVVLLLDELRKIEPPFMCQFMGDNGFTLLIGVAFDFGCAQYSSNDGMPPFLMAVSKGDTPGRNEMEFLVGDTPTPIDRRFRIAFDDLLEVVAEFVATGERSAGVSWEELP